jgi:putative hydrolase of the HAD superfamily
MEHFSGHLDIARIKGIIWDLDNTLYRFDDAFEQACRIGSARAALDLGVTMSMEEAMVVAEDAFITTGYSGAYFEREFSINRREYHFRYHEVIDEKVIEVNEEIKVLIGALNLPHVILTNASRPWAHRVLGHLGLDPWFPDDRIIAQEDTGFIAKAQGTQGFDMALERLNLPPQDILMVDDMEKNLKIPKSMGLQTVLLHHGRIPAQPTAFIDAYSSNTIVLLKVMNGTMGFSPRRPLSASS